jgi:L-lactate dehydrogenase
MKIGIVGCGQVGSASAYACVLRGVGTELVLVDKNESLAAAQAEDILHATPFAKAMPVSVGSYGALDQCGIVMIAAGANQKSNETRLDLLKRNAEILEEMVPHILIAAPNAILLIATNPVDIITHIVARIAQKYNHKPGRVLGSGTILDTARFRTLLAKYLNVSSHSIHAHVLGEHGDSEVLNWSGARVSNISLNDFANQTGLHITPEIHAQIDSGVRNAAYRIIQGKGATWYGIGAAMARIARAISENEHSVLTCCAPLLTVADVHDVTLSLPHIVAEQGIIKPVYPVLDEVEQLALHKSAIIIRTALDSIGY